MSLHGITATGGCAAVVAAAGVGPMTLGNFGWACWHCHSVVHDMMMQVQGLRWLAHMCIRSPSSVTDTVWPMPSPESKSRLSAPGSQPPLGSF